MAKRNKLHEIEKEHGDLVKVIPELVNQGGQKHAAEILGTTQPTISKWLRDNGYKPTTTYSKEEVQVPQTA